MGLVKESKNVDLIIKSEPWTDKELEEFRDIMRAQKSKRRKKQILRSTKSKSQHSVAPSR